MFLCYSFFDDAFRFKFEFLKKIVVLNWINQKILLDLMHKPLHDFCHGCHALVVFGV